MWHFAGVYFCGLGIFSVSLKLIFATIGHIGFPRWELIFAIFKKFPATSIDNIFVLVKYVQSGCNRNTYFQTVLRYAYHVKPVIHCIRFVSEWKKRVVIEQTQFFCTLFLCSNIKSEYIKFTLEYIFAGEMFALIFFVFLGGRELIFAKILCHTASLVYLNFVCFVDSLSLFLRKTTIKKSRPVHRRKASAHLKVSLIACSTIEL